MSTPEQAQARLAAALERLNNAADRASVSAGSAPAAAAGPAVEELQEQLDQANAEIARLRQVNQAVATKLEQTVERIEEAIGENTPA